MWPRQAFLWPGFDPRVCDRDVKIYMRVCACKCTAVLLKRMETGWRLLRSDDRAWSALAISLRSGLHRQETFEPLQVHANIGKARFLSVMCRRLVMKAELIAWGAGPPTRVYFLPVSNEKTGRKWSHATRRRETVGIEGTLPGRGRGELTVSKTMFVGL